ncbi:MAG: MarR family winged helix-turn-helix transcriptional regulator [Alphaproteobacteria bacterium]|jgi:DNA-binding MarR family transcriptional regulator|nr:MarR family winged helix-turn-helix transcriptional regulator [Alphaproteobacteria bacterium]MDP6563384.1 MarR family winged helix-turn-helix transcriptional regulator [Alphaproteobacteria bacterium]MDP6812134.1 MarR family winged helix-turn-helix transcriptional regulator [Alphaproteobacteria bacterium]
MKTSRDHKTPLVDNPIDSTLVYHLLLLINLIAKPFHDNFSKRHSLTLNEWRIMMTLAHNPGISLSGICEHSGLHIMNVSRGIRRLVRMHRVERSLDPADRRRSVLRLSDAGAELFNKIAPAALAREDLIRGGLTAREVETFNRLLEKLIDHMRATGADV